MLFCAVILKAQNNIVHELETEVPGKGRVKVNQPARLFDLMGSMVTIDGKEPEVEGYRVMVYSGTIRVRHVMRLMPWLNICVQNSPVQKFM